MTQHHSPHNHDDEDTAKHGWLARRVGYLRYLAAHKRAVYRAGRSPHLRVPRRRLLLHDLDKLLPSRWGPYVRAFDPATRRYDAGLGRDRALHLHETRNDHHWQAWVMLLDPPDGGQHALDMTDVALREMVADWIGASMVRRGENRAEEWWRDNNDLVIVSDDTRRRLELLLAATRRW